MRISKVDWQVAVTFVGALVGAGFASGQELMQFFVKFGTKGLWGILLAGFFFSVFGGMTIWMSHYYGFRTYKDLLDIKLGTSLAVVIDGAMMIFLFLGFSVMLSGSGALFQEHLGMSPATGIFLTGGLVLLALAARHEGVLWFNSLLVPLLIVIILGISIITISIAPAVTSIPPVTSFSSSLVSNSWTFSSLLYVSYNMIGGIVVLVALSAEKNNCGIWGGVIGGMILFVLAFFMVAALLAFYEPIKSYQIPMSYLAFRINPLVFYLYGAVLWAAMLTTAITNSYGLCQRVQVIWNFPYIFIAGILLILAIPFALCDFAQLISKIYPLFGYISLIITFVLTGEYLKMLLKTIKSRIKKFGILKK
ncbi:MAG: hypothetical protein ACOX4L_00745 [Bacillota bacterium]